MRIFVALICFFCFNILIESQIKDTIIIKNIDFNSSQSEVLDNIQILIRLSDIERTAILFIKIGFIDKCFSSLIDQAFELHNENGRFYVEAIIKNKIQRFYFFKNQTVLEIDVKQLNINKINYLRFYYFHQNNGYSKEILCVPSSLR